MVSSPTSNSARLGSWILFALKGAVSVSLIAWLLSRSGIQDSIRIAVALPASALAAAALLLATYFAAGAIRWLVILRVIGAKVTLVQAIRITIVALFASQFLPSTVGADAVRAWASSRIGVALPLTLNSILIDRIGHLLLLSLGAAMAASAWKRDVLPLEILLGLWTIAGLSIAAVAMLTAKCRPNLAWLPGSIARHAESFVAHARIVFRSIPAIATIAATVLVAQLAFSSSAVVLSGGLGANLRLSDAIALLPVVILLSSIPVTIGGWGVRELSAVSVLGYSGVPASVALIVSLAIGLLTLAISLPGGLLILASRAGRIHQG